MTAEDAHTDLFQDRVDVHGPLVCLDDAEPRHDLGGHLPRYLVLVRERCRQLLDRGGGVRERERHDVVEEQFEDRSEIGRDDGPEVSCRGGRHA